MSCYLRHLKPFLGELGIQPANKEERKRVDQAVRAVVGMENEQKCPEVWKVVKVWLQDPEKKQRLADALNKLTMATRRTEDIKPKAGTERSSQPKLSQGGELQGE